ncbi:MAG TPA: hypothetical protein VJ815_05670 [Acidimicrobiia bacterium]|nr:hypothetical protein [Acidimicrobiia bacterium]
MVESLSIRLGTYELAAATEFGPRITSLRREDSPDFFVRLGSQAVLRQPGGAVYRLRGGHRLWAGPEIPEVTYAPDDHPCEVVATGDSVQISAPADSAGLEKSLTVTLDQERLLVDHRLTNAGNKSIEVAPWAITQLPLGGRATLPLEPLESGLQADRSLVLWPYSRLTDSRIELGGNSVEIRGEAGGELKLGSGPRPGWLQYQLGEWRFRKRAGPSADGVIPDRGASCQVYVKDAFVELETLGTLSTLGPRESVEHREIWEVFSGP